ncbi:MAG: DUF3943 domain-containing protein [Spirochaetes bacterium]|nr:DUF3943 domain-containing protein [Spirochaetota bacterium]
MKKIITCLCLLLLIQIQFAFAQTEDWDKAQSRTLREALMPGLIASGETLLSNLTLMLINTAIGFPWATPTAESIRSNFTNPWEWEDSDGFLVNQLGHPYQGAQYFTAGRVNGFGFYSSVFFSILGSLTWEAFGESKQASINDFITTVPGSMAMGEMLYRLHLEAHAAGASLPLVFLVSPMGGFHMIVTNGRQIPDTGQYLYQLQTFVGAGRSTTRHSLAGNDGYEFSSDGSFGVIGLRLIYGDPFEQSTAVPFRHFELSVCLGTHLGRYTNIRLISDGYLFSFSPINTERNRMSTGLSMHLDYISLGDFNIWNSTIDMYSNALSWTVKFQHRFSENTVMELRCHLGFTFVGASNYYSEEGAWAERGGTTSLVNELRNYGYGTNSKLFFSLRNNMLGKFAADLLFYTLRPYPTKSIPLTVHSSTTTPPRGTVFWLFADFTYSRHIVNSFSLGVTASFAREWGRFQNHPNTRKVNDSTSLFVAWNM